MAHLNMLFACNEIRFSKDKAKITRGFLLGLNLHLVIFFALASIDDYIEIVLMPWLISSLLESPIT